MDTTTGPTGWPGTGHAPQRGVTERTLERYANRRRAVSDRALQHLVGAVRGAHAEALRAKDETIAALREHRDELRASQQPALAAHAAAAERLGRVEAEREAWRARATVAEAEREELRGLLAVAEAAIRALRAPRRAGPPAADPAGAARRAQGAPLWWWLAALVRVLAVVLFVITLVLIVRSLGPPG